MEPFFFFLSLLFVSPFFFSPPHFFLFFFSFPPYPLALPYFVCSPSHFFFIFLFLFPFSFSLFFFLTLIPVKVGETSHHYPPLPHVTFTFFFLIFLYFPFLLVPPLDTYLNVSHLHKCTTWLMPCVTPLGFHVAST